MTPYELALTVVRLLGGVAIVAALLWLTILAALFVSAFGLLPAMFNVIASETVAVLEGGVWMSLPLGVLLLLCSRPLARFAAKRRKA